MSGEHYDVYEQVKQLYANNTEEELLQFYSDWSKRYDKDVHTIAYIGPAVAAEQLAEKLKEFGYKDDVSILDLGCGTGLAGEQLRKRGYKNVDGLDLSKELLEVAESKHVYRSLQQGRMASYECKDLSVAADQYDAVICVGVFSACHVNAKGLDDIVHVVKPGGLACFGINGNVPEDSQYEFQEKMNQLSEKGKWKLISKYYEPLYYKKGNAWFYVYQIL